MHVSSTKVDHISLMYARICIVTFQVFVSGYFFYLLGDKIKKGHGQIQAKHHLCSCQAPCPGIDPILTLYIPNNWLLTKPGPRAYAIIQVHQPPTT